MGMRLVSSPVGAFYVDLCPIYQPVRTYYISIYLNIDDTQENQYLNLIGNLNIGKKQNKISFLKGRRKVIKIIL